VQTGDFIRSGEVGEVEYDDDAPEDNGRPYRVNFGDGYWDFTWYNSHELVLASEPEPTRPKVNDRVKVIDSPDYRSWEGRTGTVTEDDGDDTLPLQVRLDDSSSGEYGWFNPEQLEVVTEEPTPEPAPETPTFEVGDKARIRQPLNVTGETLAAGTVGTVRIANSLGTGVDFVKSDGTEVYRPFWTREGHKIEKVETPTKEPLADWERELLSEPARKLVPGDTVELVGPGWENLMNYPGYRLRRFHVIESVDRYDGDGNPRGFKFEGVDTEWGVATDRWELRKADVQPVEFELTEESITDMVLDALNEVGKEQGDSTEVRDFNLANARTQLATFFSQLKAEQYNAGWDAGIGRAQVALNQLIDEINEERTDQ